MMMATMTIASPCPFASEDAAMDTRESWGERLKPKPSRRENAVNVFVVGFLCTHARTLSLVAVIFK